MKFVRIFQNLWILSVSRPTKLTFRELVKKARVLFPFQASFEKLESGTIWVDPYYRFRKNRLTFIKNTYGSLFNFFQ